MSERDKRVRFGNQSIFIANIFQTIEYYPELTDEEILECFEFAVTRFKRLIKPKFVFNEFEEVVEKRPNLKKWRKKIMRDLENVVRAQHELHKSLLETTTHYILTEQLTIPEIQKILGRIHEHLGELSEEKIMNDKPTTLEEYKTALEILHGYLLEAINDYLKTRQFEIPAVCDMLKAVINQLEKRDAKL